MKNEHCKMPGRSAAALIPLIEAAIEALPIRSRVIDGEAIVCDDSVLI